MSGITDKIYNVDANLWPNMTPTWIQEHLHPTLPNLDELLFLHHPAQHQHRLLADLDRRFSTPFLGFPARQ
jgi:hypothetical protein